MLSEAYRLADTDERRVSVLTNGQAVIAQRFRAAPVAAVRVYVRGGTVFEDKWGGSGISHLFEHIITSDATLHHTEQELLDRADAIGGLVNAYTAADHICYHASVSREYLSDAVGLLAEWVTAPIPCAR